MNDRPFGDRHGPTPDEMRRAFDARTAMPPRPEPSRYDRLGPLARALVDDYDALDLAEMLVKAQDELAALRQVARGYCPACGRGDAAPTVDDWEQQRKRAEELGEQLDEAAATIAQRTGEINRLTELADQQKQRAGQAETERDQARITNQRLNYEKQRLESELAAYRRAVAQWEINDRGTYVPLRTITAIAKAAGLNVDNPRWLMHYQRVEQAEAAIARTRDACDQLRRASTLADGQPHTDRERGILHAIDRITRALDGPAAGPAATEATGHHYLSTGCFHGDHDYCKSMTGLNGAKRPASCKKCAAPCICSCHREQPAEPAATRATDDAGPTVAEAAAHDRRWPLEKAGE